MNFFKTILRFLGIRNDRDIPSEIKVPRDDYSYNELRAKKENELNRILEKIANKGIESLSNKEREFLDKEGQNL